MNNKKVTALLLNWKRPDNMVKIINSIRKQNIDIEIILWNNNQEDNTKYDVDLQINSSKNLICWCRWLMLSYSTGEFIFTNDDDLLMNNSEIIKKCLDFSIDNNCAIGYTGVSLVKNKEYFNSVHYLGPDKNKNLNINIIKGRFMFFKKDMIKNMKIISQYNITPLEFKNNSRIEDDIEANYYIKNKKIIPSFLYDNFINLNENDFSYSKHTLHKISRNNACRFFYKENYDV